MLLVYYFPDLARSGHKGILDNGFNLNPVFGSAVFCSSFSSFFVKNLENSLKLRQRLAFYSSCDENPNQE
jgi:hypothetical protein